MDVKIKYFDKNKQDMLDIVFVNQKNWIIAVITEFIFKKSQKI